MKRILGIDYGIKRIGIAVSDLLGLTAQPMLVIQRKSIKEDLETIEKIINEKEVKEIVIGLAYNMDGSPGILTDETKSFAEKIKKKFNLPIHFVDERLTTAQSERMLIEEVDMSREKRKRVKDKIAASLILQMYLDQQKSDS